MASKLRRIRKYQRSSWKRLRKHGWKIKMLSKNGRKVISSRRAKGRHSLTPQRPQKKSKR